MKSSLSSREDIQTLKRLQRDAYERLLQLDRQMEKLNAGSHEGSTGQAQTADSLKVTLVTNSEVRALIEGVEHLSY